MTFPILDFILWDSGLGWVWTCDFDSCLSIHPQIFSRLYCLHSVVIFWYYWVVALQCIAIAFVSLRLCQLLPRILTDTIVMIVALSLTQININPNWISRIVYLTWWYPILASLECFECKQVACELSEARVMPETGTGRGHGTVGCCWFYLEPVDWPQLYTVQPERSEHILRP